MWVLHHGFKRNQLEDSTDGILLVRHAVSEDPHCLFQLLRISMLEARVSDLWPVEDAPKGLFSDREILSRRAGQRRRAKTDCQEGPCTHPNGNVTPNFDERTHVVSSSLPFSTRTLCVCSK